MKGRIGDVIRLILSLVFIVGLLWAVLEVSADEAYPVPDEAYPIEYASPNPNPIVPTLIAASETRQAQPTRRWVTVTGWWETPEPEDETVLEPTLREKESSAPETAKLPPAPTPEPTPDPTPTLLPTPEPTPEPTPTVVVDAGPTEVEMNHLMLWGQTI